MRDFHTLLAAMRTQIDDLEALMRAPVDEDRTAQTNLKFTPTFKRRLLDLADAADETMTQYIERAVIMRAGGK